MRFHSVWIAELLEVFLFTSAVRFETKFEAKVDQAVVVLSTIHLNRNAPFYLAVSD